jgi:hypothetical protein
MIRNLTYLGRVTHGRHVNERAHKPIGVAQLWRGAPSIAAVTPPPRGSTQFSPAWRTVRRADAVSAAARPRGGRCTGAGSTTRRSLRGRGVGDGTRPGEGAGGPADRHLADRSADDRARDVELAESSRAVEAAAERLPLYLQVSPHPQVGTRGAPARVRQRERDPRAAEVRLFGAE